MDLAGIIRTLGGGVALLLLATRAFSQQFPPVPESKVARYTAVKTSETIQVDGRLEEACWKNAQRSPRFVDLISGKTAIHDTRAAVVWDEMYLYVGYWIEEPFLEASLTERDSPIYTNNDVECFVAGEDGYYEFEINSLGTIYEGLFFWKDSYEKLGLGTRPEFDLKKPTLRGQEFNGVGLTNHPRGKRWALLGWDFPSAKTAVWLDGTLNDNKDRDRGWTVELAFPWEGFKPLNLSKPRSLPPKPGDVWRMDFSRFNQYKAAKPDEDSGGWAWSPHGVWDSHVPECFPFIEFKESAKP